MSSSRTKLDAVMCGYSMRSKGFTPGTIINVGVGSCPEADVWRWLYPEVPRVGIDPKDKNAHWGDAPYIQAAAFDQYDSTLRFCCRCRSTNCIDPSHEKRGKLFDVVTTTIDAVAMSYQPPFFLWMDLEGGELAALRGATWTLPRTGFLNIELQAQHCSDEQRCQECHELLLGCGFSVYHRHEHSVNVLYRNRRWKV